MATTLTQRLQQIENLMRDRRGRYLEYQTQASSTGMTGLTALEARDDLVRAISLIDRLPTTQAARDKAVIEWNYQGADIVADFGSLRSALIAAGNRLALGEAGMWNGFVIANTHPWAVTLPTQTDATLADSFGDVVAAMDVILGNIP